jgi:hypothetical protein
MQLTVSGFVRPCRPTELGIDLETLENLPIEQTNTALDVRPIPNRSQAISEAASPSPPRVVDNNGTLAGTVIGYEESDGAVYVAMTDGLSYCIQPR